MEFYYVRDPYKDIHLPSEPVMAVTEWGPVDHLDERTKEFRRLYRVFKIPEAAKSPGLPAVLEDPGILRP